MDDFERMAKVSDFLKAGISAGMTKEEFTGFKIGVLMVMAEVGIITEEQEKAYFHAAYYPEPEVCNKCSMQPKCPAPKILAKGISEREQNEKSAKQELQG